MKNLFTRRNAVKKSSSATSAYKVTGNGVLHVETKKMIHSRAFKSQLNKLRNAI